MSVSSGAHIACYHCGDHCVDQVVYDEKVFCCDGCKSVYQLLKDNALCGYYQNEEHPGISRKIKSFQGRFDYLEDPAVEEKLIQFKSPDRAIVVFQLPQMHCSSCVWLLEHLYKMDGGVHSSRTDFLKKEITIHFHPAQTNIKRLVELLATLGYEPLLRLNELDGAVQKKTSINKRIYRIAVAGFCFANIMLLSFPEYFHITSEGDQSMQRVFSILNLGLSLPVLLYSGNEFFVTAWKGLRAKQLNIDFGLALSILITFGRSLYEILIHGEAGYLDSMTGIIFFMLVGRYFQDKTHFNLQFDRNYKSFFPISVLVRKHDGAVKSTALPQLKQGDILLIHSQELIPADSKCLSEDAMVDYSFVTGESEPVRIRKGEIIYAGGRQTGGLIECEMLREVSQSYLTDLWNKDAFKKEEKTTDSFVQKLARNFTIFLLFLSTGAFAFWYNTDSTRALNALTTVLIVACPCALLLSATFTEGAMMRVFSKVHVYLKNAQVIDRLAKINHVVFDKTGTLTNQAQSVRYEGESLSEQQLIAIASMVAQSHHPLSRALHEELKIAYAHSVQGFEEAKGKGISGWVDGHFWRLGSPKWIRPVIYAPLKHSVVLVECDQHILGQFIFVKKYREGISEIISQLKQKLSFTLLSGDNSGERDHLKVLFGENTKLYFDQSPEDKMLAVEEIKSSGKRVLMIGDGLNDSGALQVSDVGMAVTDDVNNFSPACDAILEGQSLVRLPEILKLAKASGRIIRMSFLISLLYNAIGLSFAVQGELSPVVAAILMPLSSITIILFTTGMSWLSYYRWIGRVN